MKKRPGRPKGSVNKLEKRVVKFMSDCASFQVTVATLLENNRVVTGVKVIGRTVEGIPYFELTTEPKELSKPTATKESSKPY